jgi:hypothetical protein
MPTELQKRAVNEMVENGGKVQPAMVKAGYSKNTAKTPQKLTESKGFKELCEECGLTDELILSSLTEDIKAKPQNRKPELELGAKIKGLVKDRMELSGDKDNPIPIAILGGQSNVQSDNSDEKDIESQEKDQGDTRRDISQQDDINYPVSD